MSTSQEKSEEWEVRTIEIEEENTVVEEKVHKKYYKGEKVIRVGSGEKRRKYIIEYDLSADVGERYVKIDMIYYPTQYANNWAVHVMIQEAGSKICLDVWESSDSWDGTGAEDILTVCWWYDTEETLFDDPDTVESIKTEKDVIKFVKDLTWELKALVDLYKEHVLGED
jgi:hypothetical protein